MYWPFAGFEEEERMEVELGSIYQINHSKLTPRTPVPLRSIRLVMVRFFDFALTFVSGFVFNLARTGFLIFKKNK